MLPRRVLVLAATTMLLVAQLGAPAPVGAVVADAPNTCAGATTAQPLSTWIKDTIEPSGDVDWFRFTTTSGRYALITLGKLAANYKLELYSSCSSPRLAYSNRSGRQYEEIYKKLAAGTYFVRLTGISGAHSTAQYQLRFRSLADGVTVLSYRTWRDSTYFYMVGEVLNNTSQVRDFVKGMVTFYDAADTKLGSTMFVYTHLLPLDARTRSPFGPARTPLPAGYDHFKITADPGSTTDDPVLENVTVKPGTPYDSTYYRHYPGTLTNGNTFALTSPKVTVTLYNDTGSVIQAGYTYPGAVAAGATKAFDILIGERYAGANRLVYQVRGDF